MFCGPNNHYKCEKGLVKKYNKNVVGECNYSCLDFFFTELKLKMNH